MTARLTKRLDARNEGGFTLIELLIVIVILGILAAIVVFAVGSTRQDAVNSSCKTEVSSLMLAAEAGKTKHGVYPAASGTDKSIVEGGGGLLRANPIIHDDYTMAYVKDGSNAYSITFVKTGSNDLGVKGTKLERTATAEIADSAIDASCAKP